MSDLYIRPAHIDEIVTILSEWQIATKLSRPVLDCLGSKHNYTLIVYKGYKLLVSIVLKGKKAAGVYEVHIACPRDSIKASRALAMLGMRWVLTDTNIKAKKLITRAPEGKITNFAIKLGFILDTANGQLVYEF